MSIKEYAKETLSELKKVSWPTRKQTTAFTFIVIVISVLVSFFLGFFDYVFKLILEKFFL